LLLSLPWLVPSLISAVHTDPRGADVFAARADTPLGRLGSLVMLSGIWNAQTVPRGYGGTGAYVWLLVVASAVGGYLLVARRERAWAGLGSGGLLGLAVAAVGISVPTRAVLHGLIAAWPGFAVLRDGQQFVATLALVEAVGIGSVIAWLLSYRAPLRATQAAGTRVIGATPAPHRTEPGALALAVLAMLAPVVLLPGLAWGAAGRLRSVEYPPDWLAARQFIDGSAQRGSVLLLPWAAYRRYAWNHGEAVYDPWSKLLSRELISNDGLRVGSQTLTQESPASIRLNSIVGSKGPLTVRLRAAGVRFVVVDAGPLLTAPRSRLAGRANLPGARVLLASRDLVLFLLPGPG
jgi:hypothetical protein